MLKTYRIIPLVFILFLFGFTLITVAPVFAWDKSMGMRHPDRPCMKNAREKGPKFGCGPDMRSPELIKSDPYDTGVHSPMPTSTSPSGGEVAELNAKISQLEAGLTELKGVVRTLQEQIASDPYDTNNPASQEARARIAAGAAPEVPKGPLKVCINNSDAFAGGGAPINCEQCKQCGGRIDCATLDPNKVAPSTLRRLGTYIGGAGKCSKG